MNPGDPLKRVALARSAPLLSRTGLARKRPESRSKRAKAGDWTQEVREAVSARCGDLCEVRSLDCTGGATDLHHRLRRRSADHRVVNALAACRRCHSALHATPQISRLAGWIVPTWHEPENIPVRVRGRLVLLTEDGKYQQVSDA